MKRPLAVLGILFATLSRPALGDPAQAGVDAAFPRLDPAPSARGCATPPSSPHELERVENVVRHWTDERVQGGRAGITVPVAFHVLFSGSEGQVSDAQIAAQIDELNRAYRDLGIRFTLVHVDRTESRAWFKLSLSPGKERAVKTALAVDPAHTLNLYSCGPGGLILGWSYYPWSFPESDPMHGVVVHYGTLPGGYLARYNLGRTAVHEVGHYLGLLHTFENGCNAPGDYVEDTPFEAKAASGCPEGRNTCPQDGLDPIHNYMDYTDDPCVTEFTSGQSARIAGVLPAYRPSLIATRVALASAEPEIAVDTVNPADASRALEFRGASPNPFRLETAVRFAIPRAEQVRLQVFNVAGQLVTTLIDAPLPPGAHSALFAGRGLPPGLYFLHLQVGGAKMTRSVVLLR